MDESNAQVFVRIGGYPPKFSISDLIAHRLLQFFIFLAFLTILAGKALFGTTHLGFLFAYGLVVTLVILVNFFFAFVVYKDPYHTAQKHLAENPPEKEIKTFVSCMVAVRNEEGNIARCIDTLLAQSYPHKEIIIVNDASTDNTLEILQNYAAEKKIILINLEENVGKKRALGAAMRIARGKIFAFTDSDSIWAPDVLDKVTTILTAYPDVGAISGHSRVLNGNDNIITKIQDTWYEGQYSIRKAFESVFGVVSCVSGPLAVFRREAVFNFVPAWENDEFLGQEFRYATDRMMTGYVLGSKAVGEKLKEKYKGSYFVDSVDYPTFDWKIVYCEAARAMTIVPDTFSKVLKQQIRWKKSFIRNAFFTGSFYWQKPFLPALFYYLHIIFVTIGPIIVLRHLALLPLQGSILAPLFYLAGIIFVGLMFGLGYWLRDRTGQKRKWIYRPLMSLMSTLIFSWLIFYSAVTVTKMKWYRG